MKKEPNEKVVSEIEKLKNKVNQGQAVTATDLDALSKTVNGDEAEA